jgi:hypothetical protein
MSPECLPHQEHFGRRVTLLVYSHCLGLIDRNAAGTSAVPRSHYDALRAASTSGGRGGGGGGGGGGEGGGAGGGGGGGMAIAAAEASRARVEGFGVFGTLSFANHCCQPCTVNAKGADDGAALLDNRLVLRATRPIAIGEEVTFDYLDLAHQIAKGALGTAPSKQARRAMLLEHFGFECQCSACECAG